MHHPSVTDLGGRPCDIPIFGNFRSTNYYYTLGRQTIYSYYTLMVSVENSNCFFYLNTMALRTTAVKLIRSMRVYLINDFIAFIKLQIKIVGLSSNFFDFFLLRLYSKQLFSRLDRFQKCYSY